MVLAACGNPAASPVIRTGVPNATQDKPQSKLWFAQGSWWAWLPDPEGSAIWRRTPQGWERQQPLDAALRGLPGQADVWADEGSVRAVLVDRNRLAVAGLRWTDGRYAPDGPAAEFNLDGGLETATIARDPGGRWWIAYGRDRRMWVRAGDADGWTEPVQISEAPAAEDDICAIVALPDRVAVLWSDQAADTVYFRRHSGGPDAGAWEPIEIADAGGGTADDHINTALAPDGTLYVAMKNSVDRVGLPQLVLRQRYPDGRWVNRPYGLRTEDGEPSRPIVLLGGGDLFLLHSFYGRERGWVEWQPGHEMAAQPLIEAAQRVNNVTGSKANLPEGQPWIVLASDREGDVYEATLRPYGAR